jgi:hypothetical protein
MFSCSWPVSIAALFSTEFRLSMSAVLISYSSTSPYCTLPQRPKTKPTSHSAPSAPSAEAHRLGRKIDQYPYSSPPRKFKRRYRECPGYVVRPQSFGSLAPGHSRLTLMVFAGCWIRHRYCPRPPLEVLIYAWNRNPRERRGTAQRHNVSAKPYIVSGILSNSVDVVVCQALHSGVGFNGQLFAKHDVRS